MIKVLMAVMFIFSFTSCTAQIKLKRNIEIKRTDNAILVKLAHKKNRVSRDGRVVVAVIDTGFDEQKYGKDIDICEDGHYTPFTEQDTWLTDNHGHGTHIAGLIDKNSKVPYCILVMKYYQHDSDNMERSLKAFRHAIDQNVDVINYSGGGIDPSEEEKSLIKEALDKGIVIVAAAGNEGKSFKQQAYYPAMYYNDIIVVGNLMKDKNGDAVRAPSSNYGEQVDVQVYGTNIRSVNGLMTGTSQSTAIVTGRILKYIKSYRVTEIVRKQMRLGRDSFYSPLYNFMER